MIYYGEGSKINTFFYSLSMAARILREWTKCRETRANVKAVADKPDPISC